MSKPSDIIRHIDIRIKQSKGGNHGFDRVTANSEDNMEGIGGKMVDVPEI